MSAQPEPEESLVPVQPHALAPANLFGADPVVVIDKASAVASALALVIEKRQLYKSIQGRKHVLVEGWTLLGSMLGVFPKTEWTREIEGGWEARVVAVTLSGQAVGAAESMCTHSENTWRTRDEYALRSMAQTRATSKAMRQPLGFVMQLAGYEATPADEMPVVEEGTRRAPVVGAVAGEQPAASSSSPQPRPVARVTNPITIKRDSPPQVEKALVEVLEGEVVEVKPAATGADVALRERAVRLAEGIYAKRLRLPNTDERVREATRDALDVRAREHFSGKNFGDLSGGQLESLIDLLEKAAR